MSQPRAASRRARGVLPWGQGLLCGVLIAVAPPTCLLLAVQLAPGAAALLFDAAPGKPMARCMLLSGLAAAVFPLAALWAGDHGMELCLSLLSDPPTLGTAWAAQALGWLVAEALPLALLALQSLRATAHAARLRARRSDLEAEWGIAPAAVSADGPA